MKEKLIAFIEQRLYCIDLLDTISGKRSMMDQCFGAIVFTCDLLASENKIEEEFEITRLWNEVYKPMFEEKIYG